MRTTPLTALAIVLTLAACSEPITGTRESKSRSSIQVPETASLSSTAAHTGTVARGGPYNLRSGPGTSYGVVGTIQSGTVVSITCTAQGTKVTGVYGTTTLWDKLASGAWISDALVYTGSNSAVAGACSAGTTNGPFVGPVLPTNGITPGARGDDYPDKYAEPFTANGCLADKWGYCKRNCTAFVGWRMRQVNGITAFSNTLGGKRWSNAMYWAAVAKSLGYAVDKNPSVGAIAQWDASKHMSVGHVAWVDRVNADGTIEIEEYNFDLHGHYNRRTISASNVDHFIRIK